MYSASRGDLLCLTVFAPHGGTFVPPGCGNHTAISVGRHTHVGRSIATVGDELVAKRVRAQW